MNDRVETGFLAWVTRLVREQRAALIAIARDEGLLAEDALDAVQEAFATFLVLPHARALANELEDSRKLLTVLVRNQARNRRRRHDRARPHASDAHVVDELVGGVDTSDDLVARAEAHVQALGCMERLGELQRRVVELRLVEDHAGERVADLLETSPGNVAVLLHRAKRALRECMDDLD
jgi:RNA polymerase sigma-70 factor, ECF subfamily